MPRARKLIEYNVRFGDPETQVLMLRLMSDLVPALMAARDGQLKAFDLRWYQETALTVVMAAKGYPGDYAKGSAIGGLDAAAEIEGVEIFHAGTLDENGRILANGGRVLNVTALGSTVAEAQAARLCGRGPDRLAGGLLPPRYRLAGGAARGRGLTSTSPDLHVTALECLLFRWRRASHRRVAMLDDAARADLWSPADSPRPGISRSRAFSRSRNPANAGLWKCGCSSGVEHDLAKVGVEGSNPFARSKICRSLC